MNVCGADLSGRPELKRAAETLVVDTAPEIGVVLGVRNRDALADVMMRDSPRASSSSSASISRRSISLRMRSASLTMRRVAGLSPYRDAQRGHASPQVPDQIVKFGELGVVDK